MPAPRSAATPAPRASRRRVRPDAVRRTARFWLTYPPRRIKAPLIWELGHKFSLITNIRQASVTDEVGIVCLEIEGDAAEMQNGVRWLKRHGVSVEPVELSAVAP